MSDAPSTVELFVRSLHPNGAAEQQATVIDRLDRLESAGTIDAYELTVWGRQVSHEGPASETEVGAYVLDQLDAFHDWADDAGVGFASTFDSCVVENGLVGESYTVTVLPMMLLAERVGGELRFVAPHDGERGVCSIDDRLAQLEARSGLATHEGERQPSTIAD